MNNIKFRLYILAFFLPTFILCTGYIGFVCLGGNKKRIRNYDIRSISPIVTIGNQNCLLFGLSIYYYTIFDNAAGHEVKWYYIKLDNLDSTESHSISPLKFAQQNSDQPYYAYFFRLGSILYMYERGPNRRIWKIIENPSLIAVPCVQIPKQIEEYLKMLNNAETIVSQNGDIYTFKLNQNVLYVETAFSSFPLKKGVQSVAIYPSLINDEVCILYNYEGLFIYNLKDGREKREIFLNKNSIGYKENYVCFYHKMDLHFFFEYNSKLFFIKPFSSYGNLSYSNTNFLLYEIEGNDLIFKKQLFEKDLF